MFDYRDIYATMYSEGPDLVPPYIPLQALAKFKNAGVFR